MGAQDRAGGWPSERELGEGLSFRLRAAREKLGLAQAEVARRLGLSKSSIAKYEAGAHLPGVPVLVRLALGLGVSVDHLVGLAAAAAPPVAGHPELAEHLRELGGLEPALRAAAVEAIGAIARLARKVRECPEQGRP